MSVTGTSHSVAQQGLSNLAHSIRRSTALYVAMSITPPTSSVDDLLRTADRLAGWLAGRAGAAHSAQQGQQDAQDEQFLGENPWSNG